MLIAQYFVPLTLGLIMSGIFERATLATLSASAVFVEKLVSKVMIKNYGFVSQL